MNRAQLAAMISASTLSPVVKLMAVGLIPQLGDDVFNKTIPAAVSVIRPLLEGKGQEAADALGARVPQEERDKLLALLGKF